MRFKKSLVICLLGILSLASRSVLAEDKQPYFRVLGGTKENPNETIYWSQPFDDEGSANRELLRIEREHARGGLLEFSPMQPVGLYVSKFLSDGRIVPVRPGTKEPEPQRSAPRGTTIKKPDLPFVDAEPYNAPAEFKRKSVTSAPVGVWVGRRENKYNSYLALEVKPDGSWNIDEWSNMATFTSRSKGNGAFEVEARVNGEFGAVYDVRVEGDTMVVLAYPGGRNSGYVQSFGPSRATLKRK